MVFDIKVFNEIESSLDVCFIYIPSSINFNNIHIESNVLLVQKTSILLLQFNATI